MISQASPLQSQPSLPLPARSSRAVVADWEARRQNYDNLKHLREWQKAAKLGVSPRRLRQWKQSGFRAEDRDLRKPVYSFWTSERIDELKNLWADGLSASQISDRFGGEEVVSRCAVIGKVHRLGLAGRATTSRVRSCRPRSSIGLFASRDLSKINLPRAQKRDALAKAHAAAQKHPVSQPRRPIPELLPPPDGVVTILTATACMCRWPVGDPMEEGFHLCGRHKAAGGSYCDHHAAIAYNPDWRSKRRGH